MKTVEECYDNLWNLIIKRSQKIIDCKSVLKHPSQQEYLNLLDEVNLEGAAILGRMVENHNIKDTRSFSMHAEDFSLYLDILRESEITLTIMLMKGAKQ